MNIDEDDDGNKASGTGEKKASPKKTAKSKTETGAEKQWLSKAQLETVKRRYSAGETDIIQKTFDMFKMRKEYRQELQDLLAKPDLPFETATDHMDQPIEDPFPIDDQDLIDNGSQF